MTTTVHVSVPEHADWVVDVVVTSQGNEVQHSVLAPGSSEYFTMYDDREVKVKEIKNGNRTS